MTYCRCVQNIAADQDGIRAQHNFNRAWNDRKADRADIREGRRRDRQRLNAEVANLDPTDLS